MKNYKTLWELLQKDEIEKKLYDFIKENYKEFYEASYQVDVYVYINDEGTDVDFDTFTNVGGNSWLDDDHLTIYQLGNKCTHSFMDDDFNSYSDFIDYMKDYDVKININNFKDEDGNYDDQKAANYIRENYPDEYEKAKNDALDEAGYSWIIEAIFDKIKNETEYED